MGITFLKAENIVKRFGGLIALNNFSFTVEQGEIVGLIGPNGAGKTTFFNVVTGIDKPTAGRIFFKGEEITKLKPYEIAKRKIFRTFQKTTLFFELTVLETVKTGMHVMRSTTLLEELLKNEKAKKEEEYCRKRAEEILALTDLTLQRDSPTKDLSYGQQRRMEFALALAGGPELLLLDEPTAGLSRKESDELIKLIRNLRDEGITFVIVEHDMKTVMNVCDRIVVLNFGEKIAEGSPKEIATNEKVIEAYLGSEVIA